MLRPSLISRTFIAPERGRPCPPLLARTRSPVLASPPGWCALTGTAPFTGV